MNFAAVDFANDTALDKTVLLGFVGVFVVVTKIAVLALDRTELRTDCFLEDEEDEDELPDEELGFFVLLPDPLLDVVG